MTRDKNGWDELSRYMNKFGRFPILSREKEHELGTKIQAMHEALEISERDRSPEQVAAIAEGRRARDLLVNSNMRLALNITKRNLRQGIELMDSLQEATAGLCRAADKFDPTKGYKFSTYATWWIYQAVSRHHKQSCKMIRLPIHIHEQLARAAKVRNKLQQALGRNPTEGEMAQALKMSPEKYRELRGHDRKIASLDSHPTNDDDLFLIDLIHRDSDTLDVEIGDPVIELKKLIEIADLDRRELYILQQRYFRTGEKGKKKSRPVPYEEIGTAIGFSRQTVIIKEQKIIKKLRAAAFCPPSKRVAS